MLTDAQRLEFERTGIVKLAGVFSPDAAARMRDVLWAELLERHGIDRDDRSTWHTHHLHGLKRTKQHYAFEAILGPALEKALDELLGAGRWERPKHHGQVLVTMPDATEWRVPHQQWHTDVAYEEPPHGVKHWAFFDTVQPGGGGTVQLAGSHRLLSRYLEGKSPAERSITHIRDGFHRSHPWLRMLTRDDGAPDRNERLMANDEDIDGLPARVVELTGEPGDVYLTDLWIMHARPHNATSRPRMMRSKVFSTGGE